MKIIKRPKILAISGGGMFAGPDLYLGSACYLGADLSLPKPFSEVRLIEALAELGLNP